MILGGVEEIAERLERGEGSAKDLREDIAFLIALVRHMEDCTDPEECKDGIDIGCYEAAKRSLPKGALPLNGRCVACGKEVWREYLSKTDCIACRPTIE